MKAIVTTATGYMGNQDERMIVMLDKILIAVPTDNGKSLIFLNDPNESDGIVIDMPFNELLKVLVQ